MTATLPTCPREDCTFTDPHHDHDKRTGEVRDRSEESDCACDASTPYYTRCYAPRTPQPQPAAVVLPTVDEVADVLRSGDGLRFYSDSARDILDLIASRLGSTAADSKSEASGVGTPIDPADVRVGDRVRVEYSATIDQVPQPDGKNWVGHDFADRRFYLLDRPDPDAELIERIARAIHDRPGGCADPFGTCVSTSEYYRDQARIALAAIRAIGAES